MAFGCAGATYGWAKGLEFVPEGERERAVGRVKEEKRGSGGEFRVELKQVGGEDQAEELPSPNADAEPGRGG